MRAVSRAQEIRKQRGLSMLQAAALCGVELKTFRRLERGEVEAMHVVTILRVARGLRVAATNLIPSLKQIPVVRGSGRWTLRTEQ